MKRGIIIFMTVIVSGYSFVMGQGFEDGIRLNGSAHKGTSKFEAMGGVLGSSLTGDLSSISINPAASSFYSVPEYAISFSFGSNKDDVSYFNTLTSNKKSTTDIGQLGIVFVLEDKFADKWKKIALSINYQETDNFENNINFKGINPDTSIDSYFLGHAQGFELRNLKVLEGEDVSSVYSFLGSNSNLGFSAQQAFLGYQGFVINGVSGSDTDIAYRSEVIAGAQGFQHTVNKTTSGYNRKYRFNISSSYSDNIKLGFSLNTYVFNYSEKFDFYEDGYASNSNIQSFKFRNELSTEGTGVSFDLGAVLKINKFTHLGLSYKSPVWYRLQDELSQSTDSFFNVTSDLISAEINPNIINVYDTYTVRIPSNYTASLIFALDKKVTLGIDYSYKDYSETQFTNAFSNHLIAQNNLFKSNLKEAFTLQIGGEYVLLEKYRVRAGYISENSFLKNYDNSGQTISFGFGVNFGSSRLDLSYQNNQSKYAQPIYETGLIDLYETTRTRDIISLTYVKKF